MHLIQLLWTLHLIRSDLEDSNVIDTSQSLLSALDLGRKEAKSLELQNIVPSNSKISEMEFEERRA